MRRTVRGASSTDHCSTRRRTSERVTVPIERSPIAGLMWTRRIDSSHARAVGRFAGFESSHTAADFVDENKSPRRVDPATAPDVRLERGERRPSIGFARKSALGALPAGRVRGSGPPNASSAATAGRYPSPPSSSSGVSR